MNFFGFWSQFHQQLDPDPHQECGSGRQIECGSIRIRIRNTASDKKETEGKPWERVDLFRGFGHDDVKKANKKECPTGKRYRTIPIFRGRRYSLRINILRGKRHSLRKTVFACVILRRKWYGTYSSKELKKPTEEHNGQEANHEMI